MKQGQRSAGQIQEVSSASENSLGRQLAKFFML